MVHAEVVLQRDGGKGLCGSLYLHVLLGFHGLVQAIRPAAAFHDTTRLLVDNLHLTINNHVLIVTVEHTVCLQQLLQGMNTLRLYGIVLQGLVFLVDTLLVSEFSVALEGRELSSDIGQHEEVLVVHLIGKPSGTLVSEVAGVQFLVYHKEQRLYSLRHTAVVVFHIGILRVLQTTLDTILREELDERLVLRHGLEGTEQREESFFL